MSKQTILKAIESRVTSRLQSHLISRMGLYICDIAFYPNGFTYRYPSMTGLSLAGYPRRRGMDDHCDFVVHLTINNDHASYTVTYGLKPNEKVGLRHFKDLCKRLKGKVDSFRQERKEDMARAVATHDRFFQMEEKALSLIHDQLNNTAVVERAIEI